MREDARRRRELSSVDLGELVQEERTAAVSTLEDRLGGDAVGSDEDDARTVGGRKNGEQVWRFARIAAIVSE